MEKKSGKRISRRNFLKASAITVVAATGADALAASAPGTPVTREPTGNTTAGTSPLGRVAGYCGEGDWLGTAPVIPDSKITKTVDADVIVLGGGHAGLLAALGASDTGAKVAVIETKAEAAFDEYFGRVGEDIGHVNSKWLINRGYGPYDTGEIVAEFVKRAAGRCNPDIIRLFVEYSGPMFDRLEEVYKEYKDLRKKNDSKVEFKYTISGGMMGGTGGAPGGSGGGMPGGAGGAPGGRGGDMPPQGGMPSGTGGAGGPGGGMPEGGMPGGAGNAITKTYNFSNIMSEKYLYNQVQKDLAPEDYPIEMGGYKTWPCNAMFQGPVLREAVSGMVSVLRWFLKYQVRKTIDQGTDWYYGTSALALTQEANGDVTGAIAQDAAGKYIKFKARKGVILATGGFQNNPDMCWALLNESQEWAERGGMTRNQIRGGDSLSGQGLKMGCWAGGMIEPTPRGGMSFGGGTDGPWGMGVMLQLNAHAKRFCNEAAVPVTGQAVRRQPKGIMCLVTDKKYLKSIVIAGLEHGGPNFGRSEWLEDMEEDMAKVLGAGAEGYSVRGLTVAERNPKTVIGANTLEELAGYLGYTGDLVQTFIASIKHYNELCYAGVDSDYGKDAKAMIPIDEPPFYGCKGQSGGGMMMGLGGMATLSGLMCDDKLRVLDKDGQPIKGLFASGNTLGGRYGLGYSTPFAGNSIGMAMTHGWLSGKFAATI